MAYPYVGTRGALFPFFASFPVSQVKSSFFLFLAVEAWGVHALGFRCERRKNSGAHLWETWVREEKTSAEMQFSSGQNQLPNW